MKKKQTKRDLKKFVSVNTHKRRSKEMAQREIIKALEEIKVSFDGFVYREKNDMGRKSPPKSTQKPLKHILGVYHSTRSGFGFVTPEGRVGMRDIFIPEGQAGGAIDGDFVECAYRV